MSLATWKEEFYPTHASNVAKEKALDHSIKKWEGLSVDNLLRHEVGYINGAVVGHGRGGGSVVINDSSCALCHAYRDNTNLMGGCDACPGKIANGRTCDHSKGKSPFLEFCEKGDNKPMLRWLMKAKKNEKEVKP